MALEGWHRVDPVDVPDDGRVRSVVVDGRTVALARCGARLGALDNRCPHQGGPLGEGPIENGWLRCPWHGYDYDPISGRPPEGFTDGVPSYERAVRLPPVALELRARQVRQATEAEHELQHVGLAKREIVCSSCIRSDRSRAIFPSVPTSRPRAAARSTRRSR